MPTSSISSKMFSTFVCILLSLFAQGFAEVQPGKNEVVVHYHRYDGDYERAGLWTWDGRNQEDPDDQEVFVSGRSEYGVYFVINQDLYGNDNSEAERIGIIPRLRENWNEKDGGDRFWTPSMGQQIWLIGTDPNIYTSEPDTSPKITATYVDGANVMTLVLSHAVDRDDFLSKNINVTSSAGNDLKIDEVRSLEGNKSRLFQIELEEPLEAVYAAHKVQVEGYDPAISVARKALDDRSLFYTEDKMGTLYSKNQTTFRIFSPMADKMELLLFEEASSSSPSEELEMEKRSDGVWELSVEGDLEGVHYAYRFSSDRYGTHLANDPHATNTTGDDGYARITDIRAQDPEGFRPVIRPEYGDSPTDAVIYEVHVRDFSIDPDSGVPAELRGKYLGMAMTGTHLPEKPTISTGIDHLLELGITHVQILPLHDFDNDEDNTIYNWGYMTAFFNSPEGWYSTEIQGATRVHELKTLVHELKKAGIGVILDVVYNHTGVQNTFEKLAPKYYHRFQPDGTMWNGSGTGNEFRSEAPMGRQYIVDSCRYWVEEYGFDGFRFDLMGLIDLETMKEVKRELQSIYPNVLVYGEPWAAAGPDGVGIDRITYKDVVRGSGVGAFNDHFRNALKGEPDGSNPGYVQNGSRSGEVKAGIEGGINDWTEHPWESINYATCHDNLTLWDKLLVSTGNTTEEELRRMQMLTFGILSVSQGVLFFHAGSEFARTKQGNHNSYNAGDDINLIDWSRKVDYREIFEYYRDFIALRREHPVFRLSTRGEVTSRLTFHEGNLPASETIVFHLDGTDLDGEEWNDVLVFINPTSQELEFKIPVSGKFDVYAHGTDVSTESLQSVEESLSVEAKSLTLIAR